MTAYTLAANATLRDVGTAGIYIGPDQPDFGELPGLWIQTGLGAGGDMTFWVEDGA